MDTGEALTDLEHAVLEGEGQVVDLGEQRPRYVRGEQVEALADGQAGGGADDGRVTQAVGDGAGVEGEGRVCVAATAARMGVGLLDGDEPGLSGLSGVGGLCHGELLLMGLCSSSRSGADGSALAATSYFITV